MRRSGIMSDMFTKFYEQKMGEQEKMGEKMVMRKEMKMYVNGQIVE